MEIKLLHNCVGAAAKDVTEREVRVAFKKNKQKKKTYDVSQTRGEAEGRKKRESG